MAKAKKAQEPDMAKVRSWARKWGITGEIRKSTRQNKKLMVKTPKGQWVHFGSPNYGDYTTHNDRSRQENYCARSAGIRNGDGSLAGNDPESPNFYAMRLLWDCAP